MRWLPILFLLLVAANGASHRHHPMMSNWHMSAHNGTSAHDFGRNLGHFRTETAVEHLRLDHVDLGNGGKLGVGFVQGRHMGLRFKLPF